MPEKDTKTVALPYPIKLDGLGDTEISKLEFREPTARDLKGIKLLDLLQMDPAPYAILVPRICTNGMSPEDFYNLKPANLLPVITTVALFFGEEGSLAS